MASMSEAVHFTVIVLLFPYAATMSAPQSNDSDRNEARNSMLQHVHIPVGPASIPSPLFEPEIEVLEFDIDHSNPTKAIRDFCPTTEYCNLNISTVASVNETLPYCLQCDCTEDCKGEGVCCKDLDTRIGLTDQENLVEHRCFESVYGRSLLNPQLVTKQGYLVIQTCPESASSEERSKCLQPGEDSLDEMVPAYSQTTGLNYRNTFCAKCNMDAENLTFWAGDLQCLTEAFPANMFPANVSSVHQLSDAIRNLEECFLQWRPARMDSAKECIVVNSVIDFCLGPSPDAELLSLCKTVDAPVRLNLHTYKNIFCAKCNLLSLGNAIININMQSLTTVFHPEAYIELQKTQQIVEETNCKTGKVFDETLRTCIYLSCPVTEVTAGDQCVPFFEDVEGLSYEYHLKLTSNSAAFSFSSAENLKSQIIQHIFKDADVCKWNIFYMQVEGGVISIRINIILNLRKRLPWRKAIVRLQDMLQDFQNRHLSSTTEVPFSVEKIEAPFKPLEIDYLDFVSYENVTMLPCGRPIVVSNIQTCNLVKVKQYVRLNDGKISVEDTVFHRGEYLERFDMSRNGKLYVAEVNICHDTYVKRVMNLESMPGSIRLDRSFVQASHLSLCRMKVTEMVVGLILCLSLVY